ncbi:hypothetical protein AB9X74_23345, partial [Pseudomonas sp. Env-17]
MTVPGKMSLGVVTEHRAWGVYFNASRGAATNGLMGIFSKTHGIQAFGLVKHGHCESWLACDGLNSVWLKDPTACIAGKPAPTWGLRCIQI